MDLHTHCGYQTMLPEAIAIVMAPTDPDTRRGLFRLVEPHGLKLIQECELRGFHTHRDDLPIYQRSGHVTFGSENPEAPVSRIAVVDMR